MQVLVESSGIVMASRSSAGPREINEDAILVDAAAGLYAVIDGAGGPGRGDLAAALVKEDFEGAASVILERIEHANARILERVERDPLKNGMKATFALAVVSGYQAEIHHLGEVRAYLVRQGAVRRLTEDHTLATQLVRLKQISPEAALTHPARKSVLRFLGQEGAPKVATKVVDLAPGDLLVLCSDGLYTAVPESALGQLAEGDGNLQERLDALFVSAESGAQDNLSAVVIQVPDPAAARSNPPSASWAGLDKLLDAAQPAKALAALVKTALGDIRRQTGASEVFLARRGAAGWEALGGDADRLDSLDVTVRVRAKFLDEAMGQPGPKVSLLSPAIALPMSRSKAVLCLCFAPGTDCDVSVLQSIAETTDVLATWLRIVDIRQEGARLAERFALLTEIGRAVSQSLDIEAVLRSLLKQTLKLTHADRAFVILPKEGSLSCRYGLDSDGQRQEGLDISYTFANKVLTTREPLCIVDTGADESSQTASVLALDLRSLMCVPLLVQEELIGLLYVSSSAVARTFTDEDLDFLVAIAGQTALSVQNAIYVEALEQKQRMDAELAIARSIQMGLLSTQLPAVPGYSLAARCLPATQVGGDLFEVLWKGGPRLGLFIGDVSGKNVSAALYMAVSHMAVKALLADESQPDTGLKRVNAIVSSDLKDSNYVTALFASIDAETGTVRLASAGHPPAYVVSAQGQVKAFKPRGMFLGMESELFDDFIELAWFSLEPGDALVVYTDGVSEARNSQDAEFGEERLEACLRQGTSSSAEALLERIYQEVAQFVGSAIPYDDMTVLIARREGP